MTTFGGNLAVGARLEREALAAAEARDREELAAAAPLRAYRFERLDG